DPPPGEGTQWARALLPAGECRSGRGRDRGAGDRGRLMIVHSPVTSAKALARSGDESSRDCGPLLVVPALRAGADSHGRFVLTRKFLDGVREYVAHWPGEVMVAVRRARGRDTNLDHQLADPSTSDFTLEWLDEHDDTFAGRLRDASVVLASLV